MANTMAIHGKRPYPVVKKRMPMLQSATAIHWSGVRRSNGYHQSQQDGYQWVDVVADGCLYDAVYVHGEDIHAPVHGDERSGRYEESQGATILQKGYEVPAPHQADDDGEYGAPYDALADDLPGADIIEQLPIQREGTPENIAGEPSEDPSRGTLL